MIIMTLFPLLHAGIVHILRDISVAAGEIPADPEDYDEDDDDDDGSMDTNAKLRPTCEGPMAKQQLGDTVDELSEEKLLLLSPVAHGVCRFTKVLLALFIDSIRSFSLYRGYSIM